MDDDVGQDRRRRRFLTKLHVELVRHAGSGTWRLTGPLVFRSMHHGTIIVPAGFETDFASVPRVVLAYLLTGNTAHAAAVLHDYLYRTPTERFTRAEADNVLQDAMIATKVPAWRRWLIYTGVRVGGSGHFRKRRRSYLPA